MQNMTSHSPLNSHETVIKPEKKVQQKVLARALLHDRHQLAQDLAAFFKYFAFRRFVVQFRPCFSAT